jgi:hypothetical protein
MSATSSNARPEATSQVWRGFKTKRLPAVPSWIETLGRAGHFAIAAVYLIIGVLAFQLAIGSGGDINGARGAIREIGQQPYGRLLLGLTAIGLIGYTAWRWVQAGRDTDGAGNDAKGIGKRVGYAASGLAYLVLGCYAGSLSLGLASGGTGSSSSTAFLLDSTWGRIVLGIAGVVLIGVACYFVYKAYTSKFMTKYRLTSMSEQSRVAALRAGQIGLTTKGIAFAIVGGFIVSSAYRGGSGGDIAGLADALATIAAQPFGKTMLAITGLGLICYAVHMALMGWFRRFNVQ